MSDVLDFKKKLEAARVAQSQPVVVGHILRLPDGRYSAGMFELLPPADLAHIFCTLAARALEPALATLEASEMPPPALPSLASRLADGKPIIEPTEG